MKRNKQIKQRVNIPVLMATKTMKDYLASIPTEEADQLKAAADTLAVARHSGADKRVGYLLSAYHHITSIQALLQADIEILLDDWNLYLKGIRPALTSVQQCNDKFFTAMRCLFSKDEEEAKKRDDYYRRDVDSLFAKFMRWEGLPVTWKPGQEQRTNMIKAGEEAKEETIIIENPYEWVKIGAIDVEAIPNDYRSNIHEVYDVGKMMDNESVEMSRKPCRSLSAARGVATKCAKAERGKTFIIYKRVNYWHYIPVEYKSMADESEV